MRSRRDVLKTLPLVVASCAIPAGIISAHEADSSILSRARELAAQMRSRHGGEWRISIDDDNEFILISQIVQAEI